jgi:asparagine synthase (glutamine-hydrolysing)
MELTNFGHSFISKSDTEVLLHAYQQWGTSCLEKLRGMFAFVIYNEENHQLFCARDRAGVKPFYYYHEDGLIMFSSELKAFHQHPSFKKEINQNALAAFLQYGNIPGNHCIFNNAHKLKAGHYFKHNITDQKIEQIPYWDVKTAYRKPKLTLGFEEAKAETEIVLQDSFKQRMVSDVPVGIFLSGGYDSTAVAALLQKNSTTPIKTYTVAVDDETLNEAPFARQTAEILGTDHTEMSCSLAEAKDLIQKLPYYYDEPFGDSSAIPTIMVSQLARKHVSVALSADGGDEVFAGYNRYDFLMKHGQKLNKIPKPIRSTIANVMDRIPSDKIPFLKDGYNFHNRYEKLKNLLKNSSVDQMMASLNQQYSLRQVSTFFKKPDLTPIDQVYSDSTFYKESQSDLAYMMAIDYQTYMVDDILQKVDRATMSVGLEGRDPFVDHNIIEWAARLPDNYKYHKGVKKHILKEIVHQYVPKETLERPKMGFAIPIASWLQNELKPMVEDYLSASKIEKQGLFKVEEIEKLKNSFYGGKKELDVKIWYFLCFQMWYEEWM